MQGWPGQVWTCPVHLKNQHLHFLPAATLRVFFACSPTLSVFDRTMRTCSDPPGFGYVCAHREWICRADPTQSCALESDVKVPRPLRVMLCDLRSRDFGESD